MGAKWEERRKSDRIGTAAGLVIDTSGRFVDPLLGREAGDTAKGKYSFVKDAIDVFKSALARPLLLMAVEMVFRTSTV
jgi:hypothetical protein